MPTSVSCPSCGARLRLPDNLSATAKSVKCSKCKASVPLGAAPAPQPAPAKAAAPDKPAAPARPKAAEPEKAAVKKAAPDKKPAPAKAPVKAAAPEATDDLDVVDDLESVEDEPAANGKEGDDKAVVAKKPKEKKPAAKGKEPADEEEAGDDIDIRKKNLDAPMLQLREWIIKPITGQLFSLGYNVLEPKSRDQIGTVKEKVEGFASVARFFMPKKYLPTKVEIRDAEDDKLICYVRRGPFFFRPRMEVFDPDHELLCYLEGKIFSLMGGFWVYDKHAREFAEVKGQWRPKPSFHFRRPDGTELGQVMWETVATGKITVGILTQGQPWYISVARPFAEDPQAKMILLGTAVSFDMMSVAQKDSGLKIGT